MLPGSRGGDVLPMLSVTLLLEAGSSSLFAPKSEGNRVIAELIRTHSPL